MQRCSKADRHHQILVQKMTSSLSFALFWGKETVKRKWHNSISGAREGGNPLTSGDRRRPRPSWNIRLRFIVRLFVLTQSNNGQVEQQGDWLGTTGARKQKETKQKTLYNGSIPLSVPVRANNGGSLLRFLKHAINTSVSCLLWCGGTSALISEHSDHSSPDTRKCNIVLEEEESKQLHLCDCLKEQPLLQNGSKQQ